MQRNVTISDWFALKGLQVTSVRVKATKVSGYVDTSIPKKCGTCEYLSHDRTECNNKIVCRDPELKSAGDGLKKVSAENGCCNEWSPR